MADVVVLLWSALNSLFRSRVRLDAEILILRQQLNVLRRTSPKRFAFRTLDRLARWGGRCYGEPSMQAITTLGLDSAKSVCQVDGVDAAGQVVIRRQLKRRHVLPFFARLPVCIVGMEAC